MFFQIWFWSSEPHLHGFLEVFWVAVLNSHIAHVQPWYPHKTFIVSATTCVTLKRWTISLLQIFKRKLQFMSMQFVNLTHLKICGKVFAPREKWDM